MHMRYQFWELSNFVNWKRALQLKDNIVIVVSSNHPIIGETNEDPLSFSLLYSKAILVLSIFV